MIVGAAAAGFGLAFVMEMTNLNEEKAANTKLNTVATRKGVNRKASAA